MRNIKILLILSLHILTINLFSTDMKDTDHYIYTLALEKETPNEPPNLWNPTLYKIDVEKASIVKKKKIAEIGSPGDCLNTIDGNILISYYVGMVSNGSNIGKEYTITSVIDKNNLEILKITKKEGYERIHNSKRKNLDINVPDLYKKHNNKISNFLGKEIKNKKRIFKFDDDFAYKKNFDLNILDSESLSVIDKIKINAGNMKLGSYAGTESGGVELIDDKYLVVLFWGDVRLGYFNPGYVMIINIDTKEVKFVEIGSDALSGIAS